MQMFRWPMAAAIAVSGCTAANAQDEEFPGPMEPLVGYCWTAEFPDSTLLNTHCYRLVNNGTAIEDRHVVSGGPNAFGGVTTYYFDRESRRIRYTYLASDGGSSHGSLVPEPDGFMVPDDRYVGSDGQVLLLRSTVTFSGTDAYRIRSDASDNSGSRPLFDLSFTRAMPVPPLLAVVAGDLTISRAIVRAVEQSGVDAAAYIAIDNAGQADRLLRIKCNCADAVELHTIVGEAGERRMETIWPLELPAASRVEIRPGSPRHLMLVNTSQSVRLGDPVVVTLQFERAGAVRIEFQPVVDSAGGW